MKRHLYTILLPVAAALALSGCTTGSEEADEHYIKLSDAVCTFTEDGGEAQIIEVRANPEWSFESGASWLKVSAGEGSTLEVSVDPNADGERNAEITLQAGEATASIRVYQLGARGLSARYRLLEQLNSAVMSPSGRYVGGFYTDVLGENGFQYTAVVIDLETDKWHEFGPYPETLFGFTEAEVQELCRQYDMPYDKTKQWYDGYDLKGVQIYNPRSVVMSMLGHDYDSYWTKTETYEALKKYIQMNQYGLKELTTRLIAGEHIPVNPDKFQNDMTTFASADDVLTLLVHLGYLTYDFYAQTVCIPNQEVQKEFINCIEDGGWEPVMAAIRRSEDLMEATLRGDEEYVAQQIQRVHEENISILKYNDENSLACVLSLAYYAAKKTHEIYRELAGGKGFADLVFVPRKHVESHAMIVELKWDQSAQTALDQIREKKYDKTLKGYHGSMLLVGINYRKAEKTYTCKIETETINE